MLEREKKLERKCELKRVREWVFLEAEDVRESKRVRMNFGESKGERGSNR